MKKKNNPFKIWGSWIGAVIGFMWLLLPLSEYFPIDAWINGVLNLSADAYVPFTIINVIVGFLIGWGLTLLWRKFK